MTRCGTREVREDEVQVVSISYPWLTKQHPDPCGFHLSVIAEVLEMFMNLSVKKKVGKTDLFPIYEDVPRKQTAVFWDWLSCYQAYYPDTSSPPPTYDEHELELYYSQRTRVERVGDEAVAFKKALENMNDWYVSNKSLKIIQNEPPPNATSSMREYDLRGWCSFEAKIAFWISGSKDVLEMKHLKKMVREWGCDSLEEFVTKYRLPFVSHKINNVNKIML